MKKNVGIILLLIVFFFIFIKVDLVARLGLDQSYIIVNTIRINDNIKAEIIHISEPHKYSRRFPNHDSDVCFSNNRSINHKHFLKNRYGKNSFAIRVNGNIIGLKCGAFKRKDFEKFTVHFDIKQEGRFVIVNSLTQKEELAFKNVMVIVL